MFDDKTGKSCTQVETDKEKLASTFTKTFQDFDPESPEGKQLGIYMTMQTNDLHLYCGTSDASDGDGKCWNGHADCILSIAIYNNHMMLDGDLQGGHLNTFAHMTAGYILNPDLVENRYAKCAYMFDGAINSRLYWGCGDAGKGDCDNPESAFGNQCKDPKTGALRTCQADDVEVRPRNDCTRISDPTNPFARPFPALTKETPCYWTGAAFRYPDYTKAKEDNHLKEMVINRIKNENPIPGDCSKIEDQCQDPVTGAYFRPIGPNGYCCKPWFHGKPQGGCEQGVNSEHQAGCNRMRKWNEIAVDLRPMFEDLQNDPNNVILAFVYSDMGGKSVATRLRKDFKDKFGGPGDVPLIFLDQGQNVIKTMKKFGSPFKADMPPSSSIEQEEQISV